MAFSYAGDLRGSGAPVVRRFQAGTDLYIGNMVVGGQLAGTGGHIGIAAVAGGAFEDDSPIIGFVVGIADNSRVYTAPVSGTAGYGDKSTYTATKAVVLANQEPGQSGGAEVDVCIQQPFLTLIRAPIYNAVWGTALTECVVTTADTNGVTITHAGQTLAADTVHDYNTIYCRVGANKGQYRVITTVGANEQIVTIPFPHTIAVDDVYVGASCVLGFGAMDFTTATDAIDGDNDLDAFYSVYYHEINLEESGKEYAIFAFWPETAASAT